MNTRNNINYLCLQGVTMLQVVPNILVSKLDPKIWNLHKGVNYDFRLIQDYHHHVAFPCSFIGPGKTQSVITAVIMCCCMLRRHFCNWL